MGALGTAAALSPTIFGAGARVRDVSPDLPVGLPLGLDRSDFNSTHLIEPGVISMADSAGVIGRRTPWALSVDAEPYLDSILTPIVPSIDAVMAWAELNGTSAVSPVLDPTTSAMDAITRFPILGGDPNADFSAQLMEAIRLGSTASMTFFAFENGSAPNGLINRGPIPILDDRPLVRHSRVQADAAPSWTSKAVAGWRLQYRGWETHAIDNCPGPGIPVRHCHLEVCRNEPLGSSRWPVKSTLHLGTYRQAGRKCFLLYLNKPRVCLRPCSPSSNDLYNMFVTALYVAAAVAGAAIAAWVVASMASAAAAAMYLPLLLLV
jgi:hypothetical protein